MDGLHVERDDSDRRMKYEHEALKTPPINKDKTRNVRTQCNMRCVRATTVALERQ
jgi:hypothetical protein